MTAPAPTVEKLARDVEELSQRVAALERRLVPEPAAAAEPQLPSAVPLPEVEPEAISAAIPVIGAVLLGVAGAFLLRALTELGTMPAQVGVAAGFVYAAAWLFFAVRIPRERRFAAALYALTPVLILGPLVYEATLRFKAIPDGAAGSVLAAFAIMAVALCWNRPASPVPVIVTAGTSLFALVLLVAARDLLPFALALLAIAAAVDFAACFDRETSARPLLALAADLGIVICAYLAGMPRGLPESYVPVSPPAIIAAAIGLLVIYVASTAARTLVQRRLFTNFETLQTACAFSIGLGGAFHVAKSSGAGATAIGVFALLGGAVCYAVAFGFLHRHGRNDRNFHTYALFALLLVISGSYLLFAGIVLTASWCVFAVACCRLGLCDGRHLLALHAAAAMLLAWLITGVALQPRTQFFGDPAAPVPSLATFTIIASALLCYLAVFRHSDSGPALTAFAAILVWSLAGVTAHGLALLAPELAPTWGTVVLTIASAFLAACAGSWRRGELRWLVYGLMAIAAYKLIARDLTHLHTLALVVSLLLYGGTLILLPRLMRERRA